MLLRARVPARRRSRSLLVLGLAAALIVGLLGSNPAAPARAADVAQPNFSMAELMATPQAELHDLAERQWAAYLADDTLPEFTDLKPGDTQQTSFISLPKMRSFLNKAFELGYQPPNPEWDHETDTPRANYTRPSGKAMMKNWQSPNKYLSKSKFLAWTTTLQGAFQSDMSDLKIAATFASWIRFLGPIMGIAAAAQGGDPIGIAQNVLMLVEQFVTMFAPEGIAPIVGLIALFIVKLLDVFRYEPYDPISWNSLVTYRDAKFKKYLPLLAAEYYKIGAEAFARMQKRVLYEVALADVAIDSGAKAAATSEPASAYLIFTHAAMAHREMRDKAMDALKGLRDSFRSAVDTGFTDLVKSASTDNGQIEAFTDKVFPIYHTNNNTDPTAPLAWANGQGVDTVGWHYFEVYAKTLASNDEVGSNCTSKTDGSERHALDYASMTLEDLWGNCQRVVNGMNDLWIARVRELRSTAITVPDADLRSAIAAAQALPEVVAGFTVVPSVVVPKDQPWAITSPLPSSTVERTGLITGTGPAGKTLQVREGGQSNSPVVCTAMVDDYGRWLCVPSDLADPGTSTSYDLFHDNAALSVRVSINVAGNRLTIDGPAEGSTVAHDNLGY